MLCPRLTAQVDHQPGLLNDILDISPDFHDYTNTFFLADSLASFDPATGHLSPIPPSLISTLREIFDALRTPYIGSVSFDFDRTQGYVSNNHGGPGGSGSGSGGGTD